MALSSVRRSWQGGVTSNSFATPLQAEGETLNAEVTGVQVRSDGTNHFIVLQSDIYQGTSGDVANVPSYNTKGKVKIYTSPTLTEGIYLTEVCGGWWTQNLWGSGGLMLAVDNYSAHNGTTIYKITIEAGCDLPCGDSKYVTTKEVSFVNKSFGDDSVKNGALECWAQEAGVTGVQVRSDGTNHFIVLQSDIYQGTSGDVANVPSYNTKGKVKIYTSPTLTEGIYLTEVCGGWWTQNLWGSGGLMLAVDDYSAHNGTTIYKITIEAGCDLPCGGVKYATTEEITFGNLQFGSESVKNGAYQWGNITAIDEWVASYMHFGDADYDGEGTGLCITSGAYASAKAALIKLDGNSIQFFQNDASYEEARARYLNWARAYGDASPYSGVASNTLFSNKLFHEEEKNSIVAVASIGAVSALAFGLLFVMKRKRS